MVWTRGKNDSRLNSTQCTICKVRRKRKQSQKQTTLDWQYKWGHRINVTDIERSNGPDKGSRTVEAVPSYPSPPNGTARLELAKSRSTADALLLSPFTYNIFDIEVVQRTVYLNFSVDIIGGTLDLRFGSRLTIPLSLRIDYNVSGITTDCYARIEIKVKR